MTQPLDMPDGPGWWAWEDGDNRGVSEIYEGYGLIVDEAPGGLEPDYYSGRKWYRLTMPWEQPQPAIPPDVREAIITLCEVNEYHWAARHLHQWLDQQEPTPFLTAAEFTEQLIELIDVMRDVLNKLQDGTP